MAWNGFSLKLWIFLQARFSTVKLLLRMRAFDNWVTLALAPSVG